MSNGPKLAVLLLSMSLAYACDSEIPRCPVDLKPEERVSLSYPTETLAEGWVLVEFIVLVGGNTDNPHVVESSSRRFERSAVRAILRYRYAKRISPCVHREQLNYALE